MAAALRVVHVVALCLTSSIASRIDEESIVLLQAGLVIVSVPNTADEREAQVLVDDLWDGLDVALPETLRLFPKDEELTRNGVTLSNGARLQILGMFDSGTNLLGALLHANIGSLSMQQVCPGSTKEGYHCYFWKHMPSSLLEGQLDGLQQQGTKVVTVALVRSPLAQISGWEKAPYDLQPCVQHTLWLQNQLSSCALKGQTFSGVTGVWNDYASEYHRLATSGRAIVVEYERLVLNPEEVIREIAGELGLQIGDNFTMIEAPAKDHGHASGREKALQSIRDMEYMGRSPLTQEGVPQALCSHFNMADLRQYVVPVMPNERTYETDCK